MSIAASNWDRLRAAQPALVLPDDTGIVQAIGGAWSITTDGRRSAIHSREPEREATAHIAPLFSDGLAPEAIVVVGLGLGFLLDALDARGWTGKILALEPEPQTLRPLLARRDLRPWLEGGRLQLLLGPDFVGASDARGVFGDGGTPPPVFTNPALARLRPAAVEGARDLVRRMCHEARANAEARRELGARYLLNTLGNLPSIAAGADVAALYGAAPAMPAIVVGAGPSLDRALPALRDLQHRALVITVDTALRPLLMAGIAPALVVAVDPSESNARHLAEVPPCPDTFLVAEASLDPFALAPFADRTFFYTVSDHQPWPWLRRQGHEIGRLRAWGSVLTTAFDLAQRMGCGPIAFVGADLAYTDERPYCRNVIFEETWQRHAEWGQPVQEQWATAIERQPKVLTPDVYGRDARTAPHLIAFRNWLLEQMRRDPQRQYYNATGGGVLHGAGIEQVTLEALTPHLTVPPATPHALVRDRYRPGANAATVNALRGLRQRLGEPEAEAAITDWTAFAPGLSRERLVEAVDRVLMAPTATTGTAIDHPTAMHAYPCFVDSWLRPWTEAVPLVPMHIPPFRLDHALSGARRFFFRTQAARLILCSLQLPDGALLEDGQPLTEAQSVDHLCAGSYRTCKDEVHFRASDDSDPRWNGRRYTLMVPRCIAALEGLPFEEVLTRGL